MPPPLERFVSFAFVSADLLGEVAPNGRVAFAMGASGSLFGVDAAGLIGRDWSGLFDGSDRELARALPSSLGVGMRCGPLLVRLAGADGKSRQALLSACRLPGTEDRISCAFSHAARASGHEGTPQRRDMATGLLDREGFAAEAAAFVAEADAVPGAAALSLLEVSGLNGRSVPEAVRAEWAGRVSAVLRVLAVDGMVGRLGDGRFGVVHTVSGSDIDRGLAHLADEGSRAGIGLSVTRGEVPLARGDKLSAEEAVRAVRFAINRYAENGGAGGISSLGGAFEELVHDTLGRMAAFKERVRDNRFELTYQPIVRLGDRSIHHYEVLSRFDGDRSPFEEIRFAEEIGIIEQFDLAVLTRTMAKLRAGEVPARTKLAVNISGRSLSNPLFVRLLIDLLDQERDLSGRVLLEITESVRLDDLTAAEKVIQEIRRRHFAVCLDDLGAGAASFQYLQSLTVDHVKIDGSYVSRLGASARDDALLSGIVRLCMDLGVGTIAEKIETEAQAKALSGMGVTLGQGWLFGRPSPDLPRERLLPPPAALRRKGARESWG